MKNLLLTLAVIASLVQLHAQEETLNTKYIVGGGFSYSNQNNNLGSHNNFAVGGHLPGSLDYQYDTDYDVFTFSPYIGRVLTPRWTVGLNLDFGFGKTTVKIAPPTTAQLNYTAAIRQVGIGIFSRYHFNPDQKFRFFLQAYLQYYQTKEDNKREGDFFSEGEAKQVILGMAPSFLYQIQKHFRVTLRFGGIAYSNGRSAYTREVEVNKKQEQEQNFSTFMTNFDLSNLVLGAEWNF
ncbi:MAG: hypothetical protein AB8G15_15860 [Saprospiraceae bacterium]